MPVTTLNKIVSIFLVGGLVLLFATILHWSGFRYLAEHLNQAVVPTEVTALLVAGAFVLAALAGAVAEAVSDVTFRRIVRAIAANAAVATAFGQRFSFLRTSRWRARFMDSWVKGKPCVEPLDAGSLAAAYMYQTGTTEHIQWVTNEYATYILACDFAAAVLLALGDVTVLRLAGGISGNRYASALGAGATVIYALLVLAVGRYIYAYEIVYRQGFVQLEKSS